jgi:histone-lysine N-methyltransferase SETMAR
MDEEYRAVIHFLWLKGTPNAVIYSELKDVYGREVMTLRSVENWTKRFREGRKELSDLRRSGRPRDARHITAIMALIESEPFLSQKRIAGRLNLHQATVKTILCDELNMRKVNFKWIPHTLSAAQKLMRVALSEQLLNFLQETPDRTLSGVYTGDETWIYLDNPRTSMWIGTDVARPTRPRRLIGDKKRMFWIEFSRAGIGTVVMLPAGATFDRAFFIDTILAKIVEHRSRTRPKKQASGTFLHLDNARPHLANENLRELGITRLLHPPYSPDLAPCDFWLFGYLKTCLEGQSFEDEEALQDGVSEILSQIEQSVLTRVFDEGSAVCKNV